MVNPDPFANTDGLFCSTEGCHCALCGQIRSLGPGIGSGGWADPRRDYDESEEDFLRRVPDGFIRWPDDHDFKNLNWATTGGL